MRLRSPAFTPTGLEGLGLGPTNGLPGRYFIQTRHYVTNVSLFLLRRSPPRGIEMKTIQWNRRAVELAREQDVDDPLHAVCPGCGATPAMRQYGIYQCECGELEGFAPPR